MVRRCKPSASPVHRKPVREAREQSPCRVWAVEDAGAGGVRHLALHACDKRRRGGCRVAAGDRSHQMGDRNGGEYGERTSRTRTRVVWGRGEYERAEKRSRWII